MAVEEVGEAEHEGDRERGRGSSARRRTRRGRRRTADEAADDQSRGGRRAPARCRPRALRGRRRRPTRRTATCSWRRSTSMPKLSRRPTGTARRRRGRPSRRASSPSSSAGEHGPRPGDVEAGQQASPALRSASCSRTSGMRTTRDRGDEEQVRDGVDDEQPRRRRRRRWTAAAASSGPMTRVPLIITELRLTAPGRSCAVDEQRHAGLERRGVERVADPDQRAEQANSVHSGASRPTRTASTSVRTRLRSACITISYGRRGNRSASTPRRDRQQQQRAELGEHEQPDEGRRRPVRSSM